MHKAILLLAMLTAASLPCPAETITYRPGPEDGVDMWYSSLYRYNGSYFVDDQKLRAGGWGDWYYSFINFDLGCLPKQATSAWLSLMPYDPGDGSMRVSTYLYRPNNSWTESGWSGTLNASYVSSWPAPVPGTWWSIDITALYNGWQSGTYPNYGLMLVPAGNNNHFNHFRSSDYTGNTAHRPTLTVTYNPDTSAPFKLCFPLKRPGDSPYASEVSAVMDHDPAPQVVRAYNGEVGSVSPYYYSSTVVGYRKSDGFPFVLPLLNYHDGVTEEGKTWLFYDEHTGYDYPAPTGVQVYATASGTATVKNDDYNTLIIDHGNGYATYYLHMSQVLVTTGSVVKRGQLVGKVGAEGAGGPHLHVTVKNGAVRVDPYGNGSSGNLWDE